MALRQRQADGDVAHCHAVREPDAERRHDARQRMQPDLVDRKRPGDLARELPGSATEGGEREAPDILAALQRLAANGRGHVVDGDRDEALGDLLRRQLVANLVADCRAHGVTGGRAGIHVQRLASIGAEHGGHVPRGQPANQHVGIGQCQRTAAAVGGGSRRRARRLRADLETPVLPAQK